MSSLHFFPNCKSYNTITIDNSKPVTSSMSHPSLPPYSSVTPKSDPYPSNSTTLDNRETETPPKIYYKTSYSLSAIFLTSVIHHVLSLEKKSITTSISFTEFQHLYKTHIKVLHFQNTIINLF